MLTSTTGIMHAPTVTTQDNVRNCAHTPQCLYQANNAHCTDCGKRARLARCRGAARRLQVGEEVGVGPAGHVLDAAKAAALLVAARHAHDHRRVHVHRVAGVLRARPARLCPRCARRVQPCTTGRLRPAMSGLQGCEARGLSLGGQSACRRAGLQAGRAATHSGLHVQDARLCALAGQARNATAGALVTPCSFYGASVTERKP